MNRLLSLATLLLFTVSLGEANYNFTIRFYEFRNPFGLQCSACGSGGEPACCDEQGTISNCRNDRPYNCDTRIRFLLRPFGAPVETAPNTGYRYFTPSNGGNSEVFNEGPGGLLSLPNPFTITSTAAWTGKIQFFVDAIDRAVPVSTSRISETLAIINRYPIDLEMTLGPNFSKRTTYTGVYNVPGVGFDMSFKVQCFENYYGPNCTCKPLEGVYTCNIKGKPECLQDKSLDPSTDCTTCLNERYLDPSTRCTTCLSGSMFDPTNGCSTCLSGRGFNPLSNCTQCLHGFDPNSNCTTCLPNFTTSGINCIETVEGTTGAAGVAITTEYRGPDGSTSVSTEDLRPKGSTGVTTEGSYIEDNCVDECFTVSPNLTKHTGLSMVLVGGAAGGGFIAIMLLVIPILCTAILICHKRKKIKKQTESDTTGHHNVANDSPFVKISASCGYHVTPKQDQFDMFQNPIYDKIGNPIYEDIRAPSRALTMPAARTDNERYQQYPMRKRVETVLNPLYDNNRDFSSASSTKDSQISQEGTYGDPDTRSRLNSYSYPYVVMYIDSI